MFVIIFSFVFFRSFGSGGSAQGEVWSPRYFSLIGALVLFEDLQEYNRIQME